MVGRIVAGIGVGKQRIQAAGGLQRGKIAIAGQGQEFRIRVMQPVAGMDQQRHRQARHKRGVRHCFAG